MTVPLKLELVYNTSLNPLSVDLGQAGSPKQALYQLQEPKRQPMFTGNLLDYCTFVRAFETVIETRESDYARRLYYLEQHTAGRPRELVRSCLYMNTEAGYLKARKLLESKFGQKHKIAMAYVDSDQWSYY